MTVLGRRPTCLQHQLLSSVESFTPLFIYISQKQESHCTVNAQAVHLVLTPSVSTTTQTSTLISTIFHIRLALGLIYSSCQNLLEIATYSSFWQEAFTCHNFLTTSPRHMGPAWPPTKSATPFPMVPPLSLYDLPFSCNWQIDPGQSGLKTPIPKNLTHNWNLTLIRNNNLIF